ncbi:MAG: response regulator [Xenococcaceae cyanobacterium]
MQKILIIENDKPTLFLLQEILKAEGFIAIAAKNNLLGIEQAQQEQLDLIICDLIMPKLNGYGVLAQLRKNYFTAKIPTIFLTAEIEEIENSNTNKLTTDRYLRKPCTTEDILKTIAQVTKQN